MRPYLFLLLSILAMSCHSQSKKTKSVEEDVQLDPILVSQIGQYVVEAFQDSQGNLWFGTLEKGVARYDGQALTYLTMSDGLPSNRVVSILEDKSGNLWFGTGSGLAKYDGKTFAHYSESDGLCSDRISNLLIDSKENFWIGTWGGVCRYDGTAFEDFLIPYPEVTTQINPDTKDWITAISEDSKGNIWIGRDGFGAYSYDGQSMRHFTKKDGLNSNNVQSIQEDKEGNIWFGTRVAERDNALGSNRSGQGGLNKYDGREFTYFTEFSGLYEADVYGLYMDRADGVWISTTNNGVYRYSNNDFEHYEVPVPVMAFWEDRKGNVWLGCAGGLFRIDKEGGVVNVRTNGPW